MAIIVPRTKIVQQPQNRQPGAPHADDDTAVRDRADKILHALSKITAVATGEEYFRSLVRHLASTLGVRYAFVAECTGIDRTRVQTLAFWDTERFVENVTYAIAGTPCENVLSGQTCFHLEGLQALFPTDTDLVRWNADSYLGIPIYGSSGNVLGHLGVLDEKPIHAEPREISILQIFAGRTGVELERQRAEHALRESEERYRSLYAKTPVMLHSSDASGRLVSVSEHWLKTLGYERDEVIGQFPSNFLTKASRQHAETVCFPSFMKTGVLSDEPLQFQTKSGEVVDVLLSAVAERDSAEGFIRTFVVSVDVAQRRRAEQEAKRYMKRLETLQEIDRAVRAARSSSSIAEAAVGRIRELMPCLHALVGVFEPGGEFVVRASYCEAETELRQGVRVLAGDYQVAPELAEDNVHRVEDATSLPETPLRRLLIAEGARAWISVPLRVGENLIGLLHVDSEKSGAFSAEHLEIAREVADSVAIGIHQTRLLDRLKRQAEELENRVAERTSELETFSYSISHDLRSPLRVIDGFAGVLWEDHAEKLDDEGRRLLAVVRQNTRHMGQLIEDLLAFFGLGQSEMHPTEIRMSDIVKEVYDELNTALPKSRQRFEMKNLPVAQGDRAMVRQVFVNLLSNAIKFTEPSLSPSIEVGHERLSGEDVYYVKDNGVGFERKYADKLFGVFQRLHSAEEFAGTGLGLAITHRIIQRHGGRVWAEGDVNKGATIFFTLPS